MLPERSDTAFIPSLPDIPHGGEEGDNSPPGEDHDFRELGLTETTLLGTGKEGEASVVGDPEGDAPLRVSAIIERFKDQTRARLKAESQEEYAGAFLRFAEDVRLETFTRRQLAGPKGRLLLMAHLEHVPKPSWRCRTAMLKAVWCYGLDLPWPIDAKRDLGKLPRVRRRESPPDSVIAAWKKAISNEPDLRLQLEWLLIAQHGWRPSHVIKLRWRNVRYDEAGRPTSIVADGSQEGFKTSSPIAARLAPDVAEALAAWRRTTLEPLPEQPIFPARPAGQKASRSEAWAYQKILRHWKRLQKRWRLPPLRPVDVRHWVASACRRADLSKQASAYLMGHDPTQGGAMRDWYDNPQLEDVLAEQAEKLPCGPLGKLDHGTVELVEGLPTAAVNLMRDYLAGEINTLTFVNSIEEVRMRSLIGQVSQPER